MSWGKSFVSVAHSSATPRSVLFCEERRPSIGPFVLHWRLQGNALVQGLFAIHPLFATYLYVGLAQCLGK
jgi:hypothetical protein